MDKMFKRTLLASTVAMVAAAGSANAAIDLNGNAVQLYGQAAGFMHYSSPDKGDSSVSAVIESRVGFRGVVEFEDFGPNFLWQIEGGDANNGAKSGQLGARDTYLGLGFDGVGSFKYGRQLVAAYNYVDWPHSNPGLGNVFDWHSALGDTDGKNNGGVGFQDRADNVFRFDSETFGGFNFQATLSGMEKTTDDLVVSLGASYQAGPVNLHAGYYNQDETEKSYYLVGATLGLDAFTLTGAFKSMENGKQEIVSSTFNGVQSNSQDAISVTAQYVIDKVVLKAGYAQTMDSDKGSVRNGEFVKDDGSQAITARLGYLLPSTYLFIDSRNYKMNGADGFDMNILVGAEYYF
ncbi:MULTISPECIES: porin [Vibrio]|uniref:porin n=1 Tax=Vibrio TaxID=662 RepID=UPI000DE47CD7|nr:MULTISPECIES: porin [Vibrio]AYC05781.1 Arginine/ornithine antiporter ArcD [Vibrio cholerae]EGQ8650629.1 porin [Vibrio cholerae]EGQ9412922.1 porin [Vibrio cholerae]EGR0486124.1 porin [Vibrio cholerae]EGR0501432.1 porin [Vibrio cholerae]